MSAQALASPALITLEGVSRSYSSGSLEVQALKDVNLSFQAGEMVAIVGASGSGKSTLMNLLGCLDVPSQGELRIDGVAVRTLSLDELARLRRERFGFIFQRYHLIREQDALANVCMPAIYAGVSAVQRRERARALLARLGLSARLAHRPSELSGGQQQRVSIARALMNGGDIVLADEPTGALDSRSGREMVDLLKELNQQGHTVIIVTHDAAVAAHAPRVIKLEDGRVLSDSGWPADRERIQFAVKTPPNTLRWSRLRPVVQAWNAVSMAVVALARHRLRTLLSTLGIGVGIAAVVGVMAMGDAMRSSIEKSMRAFIGNKLTVVTGGHDMLPGQVSKPFSEEDMQALRQLDRVKAVRPKRESQVTARQDSRAEELSMQGLAPADLATEGHVLKQGRGISELDQQALNQVVVLNFKAAQLFFPQVANPVGRTVDLGRLPFEVIGVTDPVLSTSVDASWRAMAFVPEATMIVKMLGRTTVNQLTVYMAENAQPQSVQAQVSRVLTQRHGQLDFMVFNRETQLREASKASDMMRLVLTAIASISLLVGGVGVMNMMLVAVSERTSEIGIRMAVGARPADVQIQFLVESMVLCGLGGLLGLALSWWVVWGINLLQADLQASLSWGAMVTALAVSTAIGLVFGGVPARQASRMSPVAALSRE